MRPSSWEMVMSCDENRDQSNKKWILLDQHVTFWLQAVQGLSRTVSWIYKKYGILIFPHPTKHQTVPLKGYGFRGHPAGRPRRAKLNNLFWLMNGATKIYADKPISNYHCLAYQSKSMASKVRNSRWDYKRSQPESCHFGTVYHLTGWCFAWCRFLYSGSTTKFLCLQVQHIFWFVPTQPMMNTIFLFLSWL